MIMPVVVVPFLFLFFLSLGGGRDVPDKKRAAEAGFNTQLPGVKFDKGRPDKNKFDVYKQAELDSMRRREYLRQDPYFKRRADTLQEPVLLQNEAKADDVLDKLNKLRQTVRQRATAPEGPQRQNPPPFFMDLPRKQHGFPKEEMDKEAPDPELEKLNGMLDKIIRIQHPKEDASEASPAEVFTGVDTVANSLPAVVQEDQVLVAGGTIALRLMEAARINGVSFPKDQPAYGVVSISNDRMLITVSSLRRGQSIYSTALQVYDLDGLAGIHIPGALGRDVAKESADQGIHSLSPGVFDPSLAGQAVNAGVLTARSLLSRKVRQVRVRIRAGYQVLLRSAKAPVRVIPFVTPTQGPDSISSPPDPGSFEPFLHKTVCEGKIKLQLVGIYLRGSLLWLMFRMENHSPIGFVPDHIRWCVRDRRQARRAAIQEIMLSPVYTSSMGTLTGDSSRVMLTAFRPFALPEDKELVLQMAERNGARGLVMQIKSKEILKAKVYAEW